MDTPVTLAENTTGLALQLIGNMVETIRKGMGEHASDAVKLPPADELGAWMRETASPDVVAGMIANGASDEDILQKARQYRHALGKVAGQGDPKREVEYHEKMAAKAQAYRQAIGSGMTHEQAVAEALRATAPPITAVAGPDPKLRQLTVNSGAPDVPGAQGAARPTSVAA